MPKIRDFSRSQHDADGSHYGAISIEMLPDGDPGIQLQMPIWDGVQWHMAKLQGDGQIDITFDDDTATITFIAAEDRVYGAFTSDSVFKATLSVTFTADAALV